MYSQRSCKVYRRCAVRVLMLNYEFPPLGGGGSNACKYILKEFAKKNLDVDLVTSSPSNKFETNKIGDTINIYKLPVNKKDIHFWTQREIISYSFKAYGFIKDLMKENEYNICHAFFGIPCGAIAYLFKEKMPYIVSLRGSDVPGFNNRFDFQYVFLKPIIKKVWSNAGAVVANSNGLKELALKSAPDQKIGVIYNGIDISEFKPDINKIHDSNEFKIVCVSRLIERKGINFLIEAIRKSKNRDIKLVLVGEGNQEEELKKLARNSEVSDKVEFKGYLNHDSISDVYKNSDVFVLPSLNEGMSNALLEAMASELPVIVTDTGGTAELVDGNGFIIEKGSADSIVNALENFMVDRDSIIKMGKRSREIALGLSWANVANKYYTIYEDLI